MKRFLIIYFIFFVITNLKGQMDEKYLLGKFDPADDSNFVLVDKNTLLMLETST